MRKALEFPKVLKEQPFFDSLIKSCDGKTEVSDAFIFAGGMTALSGVLGRRIGIESFPSPLYPNTYTVLCGESGGSRKSSILSFTEELIDRSDPCVNTISGIATPEGLIRQFTLPKGYAHGSAELEYPDWILGMTDQKKREAEERKFISSIGKEPYGIDKYLPMEKIMHMLDKSSDHEGFRGVAFVDELAALLKSSKSAHSEKILQIISEFFGKKKISNQTSGDPVQAFNPCLNILAAIPIEWLQTNMSVADIMGGIGRRFQWVRDSRTDAQVPFPSPPDENYFSKAVNVLGNMRKKFTKHTLFKWHENTEEIMKEWYGEFKVSLKNDDEKIMMKSIREGQDTHIRKASLIFAALDPGINESNALILPEHFALALHWTDYILESQLSIFENYAETQSKADDQKILQWLDGKGFKSGREIYRGCGLGSEICKRKLESLCASGTIEYETSLSKNGAEVIVYQYQK